VSASLDLLFLTQTFPRREEDTAGPFIRDLARGLVRGGDRVRVLAPHTRGLAARWQDQGVEIETFRYAPERFEVLGYGRSLQADETVKGLAGLVAPLYALAARRAVARAVAARRPDLFQAHWIVPNAVSVAGATRRVRFAIGLHGSDVFLAEKPVVRTAARRALASASALTGCSPELVARVERLGAVGGNRSDGRTRAFVIPYGVDVQTYSPNAARRGLWRSRLGIDDASPVVLGVGRMATKKGFHVLVEALPALFARHSNVHVVLAGGGDRLEELRAASAPWRERVHFPGAVLRDTLPDLYRAADVFVLPAVHDRKGNVDGLPNVILEAMASGLPVVASDVSGVPLAVENERSGLLVREGDAAAVASALDRLLSDASLRLACGERGRAKAAAELTWDAVAAAYRRAYLTALS
jgi:glycosyltransferase involved in cell wall biosynthesis